MKHLLYCWMALGLLLAVPAAHAQGDAGVHRLEIRDGRVFHDGTEIPASALPDGMDVEGVTFTFEYGGPVMPALTLNGRVFALENGQLIALEDAAGGSVPRALAVADPGVEPPPAEDARQRQAEMAYLQTLSERDRALYERLMRERDMEAEALRVAYVLRRTTDEETRDRLRNRLLGQIDAIFELKQENRREEIQQVEGMLEAMRTQLQRREALRVELVQKRLSQLTGEPE
jgi:hypothetical protein